VSLRNVGPAAPPRRRLRPPHRRRAGRYNPRGADGPAAARGGGGGRDVQPGAAHGPVPGAGAALPLALGAAAAANGHRRLRAGRRLLPQPAPAGRRGRAAEEEGLTTESQRAPRKAKTKYLYSFAFLGARCDSVGNRLWRSLMRVGVFGGAFDPVHYGHLILAEQAREQARLDSVWFVPAARHPFKAGQTATPFDRRVEMLHLAITGQPAFRVDQIERDRPGLNYTADTLDE